MMNLTPEWIDKFKNLFYIPGIVSINNYEESISLKEYLVNYINDDEKMKNVLSPPKLLFPEDILGSDINPSIVFTIDDDIYDKSESRRKKIMDTIKLKNSLANKETSEQK
ncbi:hypothetical protein M0R36_10155 [bacterium]|jgi:hypothetical protein|nr:hypothetical protein [bacterium]